MERPVGIFETQMRSDWFKEMMVVARSNFGHQEQSWPDRALLAISTAELDGKAVTANEIVAAMKPLLGPPPTRHSVNSMLRKARKRGIARKTEDFRYVRNTKRKDPVYEIMGTVDLTADGDFAFSMCD